MNERRPWTINMINRHLDKNYDMSKIGALPGVTTINLWNYGVRVIIRATTVWRRVKIKVADEVRLTYIWKESWLPVTRYYLDTFKLDKKTIKYGRREIIRRLRK